MRQQMKIVDDRSVVEEKMDENRRGNNLSRKKIDDW